jgi:hypothetical protein
MAKGPEDRPGNDERRKEAEIRVVPPVERPMLEVESPSMRSNMGRSREMMHMQSLSDASWDH